MTDMDTTAEEDARKVALCGEGPGVEDTKL